MTCSLGCSDKTFLQFQKSGFLICGKWAQNDAEKLFWAVASPDGLATGPNTPLN